MIVKLSLILNNQIQKDGVCSTVKATNIDTHVFVH